MRGGGFLYTILIGHSTLLLEESPWGKLPPFTTFGPSCNSISENEITKKESVGSQDALLCSTCVFIHLHYELVYVQQRQLGLCCIPTKSPQSTTCDTVPESDYQIKTHLLKSQHQWEMLLTALQTCDCNIQFYVVLRFKQVSFLAPLLSY